MSAAGASQPTIDCQWPTRLIPELMLPYSLLHHFKGDRS
jgi:hypothetical protein